MFRTQEEWIAVYQSKDAYWLHDSNSNRPHALLTSGKHSNGFFNSRLVIPDDQLMREAASDLVDHFLLQGGDITAVETVVGPQTGATKLAQFIDEELNARGVRCLWASPAKDDTTGEKYMVFTDDDREKVQGRDALLCEDVLTTGGSVELTVDALAFAGSFPMSTVLVLVNRSGHTHVGSMRIVALIDISMPMWLPEECPLCQAGSEAIRPKGENWALLNASYN